MTVSSKPPLRACWGLVAVVLTICLASFAGCQRSDDVVAKLERFDGSVERERVPQKTWEKADRGATFTIGSAVRTGAASSALLALFDESQLSLEPNTLIRFLNKASGKTHTRFDLEMGQATLEASESLSLDMQVGTATIDAHGKIRLVRTGGVTRVELIIGSARLLTDKESLELRVGDAVDIKPDRSLERLSDAGALQSAPAVPNATDADAGMPRQGVAESNGNAEAQESGAEGRPAGPAIVDLVANAGDSFVIHDPKPPTSVGLLQNKCDANAVLILDPDRPKSRQTLGASRVSIRVPVGSHRYAVRCLGPNGKETERVAQGLIAVLADDGSRKLAKSAPVSSIDADGRHYTVLYQGHVPGLAVRWPNPPESSTFTLNVRSSSGARTFSSKVASAIIPSGTLTEGDHVLTFEGGGRHSRATNVTLRFDNAAPTASISSPADGSFAQGSSVQVAGTALPGWTVSIEGQETAQDAQNRFSQQVVAPAGQRALWIRFSHPGRGVHYYLRRSVQ